MSDDVHQKLLKGSAKTMTFLTNLTSQQLDHGKVVRKPAMPLSAFRGVKGLAFCFRRKWGCIFSFQHEFGFVTAKITAPDGSISWSAPYFVEGRVFGAGLTLGHLESGVCLALMNDEALAGATRPRSVFGLKAQFLVDMDGASIREAEFDSTSLIDNVITDSRGGMVANYFRMKAMMVDFCLQGKRACRRLG